MWKCETELVSAKIKCGGIFVNKDTYGNGCGGIFINKETCRNVKQILFQSETKLINAKIEYVSV